MRGRQTRARQMRGRQMRGRQTRGRQMSAGKRGAGKQGAGKQGAGRLPLIWLLTLNPAAGCKGAGIHSTGHNLGTTVTVLQFQVGFPIQVCSLHIAEVGTVRGGEEQQVSGYLRSCSHLSAGRSLVACTTCAGEFGVSSVGSAGIQQIGTAHAA